MGGLSSPLLSSLPSLLSLQPLKTMPTSNLRMRNRQGARKRPSSCSQFPQHNQKISTYASGIYSTQSHVRISQHFQASSKIICLLTECRAQIYFSFSGTLSMSRVNSCKGQRVLRLLQVFILSNFVPFSPFVVFN